MEPDPAPMDEPSFACTLTKALRLIKPNVVKGIKDKWTSVIFAKHGIGESPYHMTLSHFLERFPQAAGDLQQKLGITLLVIKTCHSPGVKKKLHQLLYDGRHMNQDPPLPLKCLWLNSDNRVYQCSDSVDGFPRLSKNFFRRKQLSMTQPLWKCLGLEESSEVLAWPCPTNLADLKQYIQHFRKPDTKVKIKFATGLGKNSLVCDWFQDPPANEDSRSISRIIHILAFSDCQYRWSFALELEPGLEKARKRGENIQHQWRRYQTLWDKWKENEKVQGCANAHQANCAAAINVSHRGLQLAYDLGLISKEELKRLSFELSQTFSTLYVFVDERHHLRHITYYDLKKTFHRELVCFEHDCSDFNHNLTKYQQDLEHRRRNEVVDTMMSFWQEVWDCRAHWIQQRQHLLDPLIHRLEQLLDRVTLSQSQQESKRIRSDKSKQMTSPLWRCLNDLKQMIVRHRLYMYSKEDSHLHSVKFFLTHFAYQKFKPCRGLYIKAQSDDTLTKLSIQGLTVINVHIYLSCKKDLDFFSSVAQPWCGPHPSEVIIIHHTKNLASQKVTMGPNQSMNVRAYCRQYGWMFARHIFRYWVQFNQFLLDLFGFDMHGQHNPPSASFLAFQCIWTRYVQLAGPMAHGLERTKPFFEDLLRSCSRGGLMFSIGDTIHQGKPIHPLVDEVACSIAEFDLVSAYGFGASQAFIPSGFCIGYKKLTDGHWLERLDPKLRHKSFEFRAVYKVIDKISRRQGIALRSVYHNYSPLGLFTLGKYNLDLVIVQEDGKMLLLNMDGRWIHGCDVCPPSGTFAHGQSHQQIRAKSQQRDRDIEAWVKVINANSQAMGGPADLVEYIVIYDCHSPGFTLSDLDKSFASEPTLQALLKGYQMTHQLGREFTIHQFQNWLSSKKDDTSFTFILRADVSIQTSASSINDPDGSLTVGPLVTYDTIDKTAFTDSLGDANYKTLDGRSKRNSTRQRLAWEGQIVLTRDYYQWLQNTFQTRFSIHEIDWILFYKTEPVINSIYRELVNMRSTTSDPILVSFLKKLVNLSAGFYGNRSTPLYTKTSYRLVKSVPEKYAFFRHNLMHQHTMDLANNSYYVLETKPWPKIQEHRLPSKSAVPIFLTIVEYGKLRLAQTLHFLRQHLEMGKFRVVYSNIDNIIITLANNARCLDEAVAPHCQQSFALQKSLHFTEPDQHTSVKPPGLAECKWSRYDTPWKFTTLRTQHYCLASTDPQQSLFKVSGWSDVTTQQVVEWTEQLSQGEQVAIPQTRRTHKTLGMDIRQVVLNC